MYTYHDPSNKTKIKRTFGTFNNWTKGGQPPEWYACFRNKRNGIAFIPESLLTTETRDRLPKKPQEATQ